MNKGVVSHFVASLKSCVSDMSSTRMRMIWFWLFLFSLGGLINIPSFCSIITSPIVMMGCLMLVAMLKGTVLTAGLAMTRSVKWLSVLVKIFIVFYCLLCTVNAVGYGFFKVGISIKMMTLFGQTNPAETAEFLPSLWDGVLMYLRRADTYVVLVVLAVICYLLRKIPQRIYLSILGISSTLSLIYLVYVIFWATPIGRTNHFLTIHLAKSAYKAYTEMKLVREEMAKIRPLPYPETVKSNQLTDIVMVIGESANRGNLSLYGYPLPTTPKIDKRKDELIVFSDVIGSSTITYYNMNRILTFLSDNEPADEWYQHPMLFSLMSEAGYHTAWLSNQEKGGTWSNNIPALVSQASDVRFVGLEHSDDGILGKFDDILLPELDQILGSTDKAKFVGVQLMGSHYYYVRRYPQTYHPFNAESVTKAFPGKSIIPSHAATIAEYANSISFTDSILDSMINRVANEPRPTLLIYFSDHGENVYEDGDYRGRDEKHVEVPFFIYPNRAYTEMYPQTVARLKEVRNLPLTSASLPHLICTLTGTSYQAYDATRDITSPEYKLRPRYVDDAPWEYEKKN